MKTLTQAAHQAFERILYVYKTENTSIRLLDGRDLLGSLLDNRVRAGLPRFDFLKSHEIASFDVAKSVNSK